MGKGEVCSKGQSGSREKRHHVRVMTVTLYDISLTLVGKGKSALMTHQVIFTTLMFSGEKQCATVMNWQ